MRDYRFQAFVDVVKAVISNKLNFFYLLSYLWYWLKPSITTRVKANRLYDVRDLSRLRPAINHLADFDPLWYPRLFEPISRGIRAWEYGVLVSNVIFAGKKVLDVGVGNSRLPNYLSHLGATITATDIEKPLEDTESIFDPAVAFDIQDMTKMGYPDAQFDVVISISSIEHVEMRGGLVHYTGAKFQARALQSISEMIRVLKPGGHLYLTTDFYLDSQDSDLWDESSDSIHGAFPMDFVSEIDKHFQKLGVKYIGAPDFNADDLVHTHHRANYRGRYFTTIAFLVQKPKSTRQS